MSVLSHFPFFRYSKYGWMVSAGSPVTVRFSAFMSDENTSSIFPDEKYGVPFITAEYPSSMPTFGLPDRTLNCDGSMLFPLYFISLSSAAQS